MTARRAFRLTRPQFALVASLAGCGDHGPAQPEAVGTAGKPSDDLGPQAGGEAPAAPAPSPPED